MLAIRESNGVVVAISLGCDVNAAITGAVVYYNATGPYFGFDDGSFVSIYYLIATGSGNYFVDLDYDGILYTGVMLRTG